MQKRCLIFDWDGVIADSTRQFFELYARVCQQFGRPFPVHDLEAFRRWYHPRWERNYLELGFSEEELGEVLRFAGRQTIGLYADVPLFPAVVRMLRALAREVPLGIASTTYASVIRQRLAADGLEKLFRVVVGGEGGGSDKIERYRQAVDALGFDPREAVAIGDTPLDVDCARHWGMTTVGVTYGWSAPEKVAAASPDHLIHEPSELEPLLRRLLGGPVPSAEVEGCCVH